MIPLTYDEQVYHEKRKCCLIYAEENFVMMKMIKINFKNIKKLEIIVIIEQNVEELRIVFVI